MAEKKPAAKKPAAKKTAAKKPAAKAAAPKKSARNIALQNLLATVENEMGGGVETIDQQEALQVVPTGVLTLDHALGIGGLTRGDIHMIWGRPSSGKTALSLVMIADLMRRDKHAVVAWIDVERTLRVEWIRWFGIDAKRLYMFYPANTEESVNVSQECVRSGAFDFIVVDSLGAMARRSEVEGKDGKGGDANTSTFGGSAMLIGRLVRVVSSELVKIYRQRKMGEEVIEPAVILINQVRSDPSSRFAGALSFAGGHILEHMLATIMYVQASGKKEDLILGTDSTGAKVQVGSVVNVTIQKNKNAPSPRAAQYRFCFEKCPEHEFGVDSARAILDMATLYSIVDQRGAYYTYDGMTIQGKEPFMCWLKEHPEAQVDIRNKVMGIVKGIIASPAVKDEGSVEIPVEAVDEVVEATATEVGVDE